jgi:multidrug transporter EmrE-like cation transporter
VRRSILLGFLLLLTFDTASQVGIKLAGERIGIGHDLEWLRRVAQEPLIHLVLLCYAGAFATYVSLLKYAPVGPAYAAAHGHIVTVLIISMAFLGERLTLIQGIGGLAILAGLLILAVTETASPKDRGPHPASKKGPT